MKGVILDGLVGGALLIWGGRWLILKVKASRFKPCPKCEGADRGRKGFGTAYDHCSNPVCVGGEVPSLIGRAFGVRR